MDWNSCWNQRGNFDWLFSAKISMEGVVEQKILPVRLLLLAFWRDASSVNSRPLARRAYHRENLRGTQQNLGFPHRS